MSAIAARGLSRWGIIFTSASLAGALAGLLSVPAFALSGYTPAMGIAAAIAVAVTIILVADTQVGLCFAAFAIAPLGILQREVLTVTFSLPELLILALVLKEAVVFVIRGEKLSPFVPRRTFTLYLATSALAIMTGAARGNDWGQVLQDFRQFTEYAVLFLLVLHRVKTRRQMTRIMGFFLAGMTVLAVHGIVQRFTGMGIPGTQLMSDLIFHGGIRSGSFYGSTPLGAMMVMAVGTAASLGLSSESRRVKTVALSCAATCIAAAVFTNTRASWIAMALALGVVFFGVKKSKTLIVMSVIGLTLFTATMGPLVAQRMAKIQVSVTERSLLERVRYYTAAWHIFRAHPVLGLGWGCNFSIKSIIKNGRFAEPPPGAQTASGERRQHATVHSAYLQLLVRTGGLGLLAFLLFLGQWVRQCMREWRVKNKDPMEHHLFLGLSAGLMGYLLHSSLENFFQWPVMSQSFWLLLALSTAMAGRLITCGSLRATSESADSEPGEEAA